MKLKWTEQSVTRLAYTSQTPERLGHSTWCCATHIYFEGTSAMGQAAEVVKLYVAKYSDGTQDSYGTDKFLEVFN